MDLEVSVGLHLTAAELPTAYDDLSGRLAAADSPQVRLAAGMLAYMRAEFEAGATHLERAYLDFKAAGLPRRAAVAATHLSRLQQDGVGNAAAASGWLGRAKRLLADDEDCVERGWVALATVGCSRPDADQLERDSLLALDLARRYDDVDLECKALADSGLALVSHGAVAAGMARLDEAMAMVGAGECDNQFIAAQVLCCLVTGCERCGDLVRLEDWLSDRMRRDQMMPHGAPTMLYAHCQTEYGSLLCHAGRWSEADTTLRLAVAACESLHFHHRASSRAALAGLRIGQGRVHEAAALLDGLEHRAEAQLSIARLHLARGDHDLAAATLRNAIRLMAGDRMRGVPLMALLVEAEIGRGGSAAALEVAEQLDQLTSEVPDRRSLQATAALAYGRAAAATGDTGAAISHVERGLQLLGPHDWPVLAAELHHALAVLLAEHDVPAAVTEARAALAVYGSVGAREAQDVQALLHRLGVGAAAVDASGPAPLTTREREILGLLGEGMSNPEIAQRLVISRKTAEHHVGAILRKLHLRSRSEAALYAASLSR